MALEMKVYVTAKRVKKDGHPVYHDVQNGVVIDWNGDVKEAGNTCNEVDVCMMRGNIPIFVSCKCGDVSTEELFKLNSVGNHFGNIYAKKVLIMNQPASNGEFQTYFLHRAEDMGIQVIFNAHTLSEEEFSRRIETICKI